MPTDDARSESGVSRRNYLGAGATALAGLTFASAGGAAETDDADPSASSDRLLIENGTVVTVDPDLGTFDEADVLVEDGRIERIESDIDAPDAERIDASDAIVVPGFVNAHLPTWQAGVRGGAGAWSVKE